MKISENGLAIIKESEGFKPAPYLCPAGYWTIGFGHRILSTESFISITEAEAEQLLIKDVGIAENCINNLVKVPITQNQFDALVSFVYNVGCEAFKNSTMLRLLNNAS
jgi:lysozyme